MFWLEAFLTSLSIHRLMNDEGLNPSAAHVVRISQLERVWVLSEFGIANPSTARLLLCPTIVNRPGIHLDYTKWEACKVYRLLDLPVTNLRNALKKVRCIFIHSFRLRKWGIVISDTHICLCCCCFFLLSSSMYTTKLCGSNTDIFLVDQDTWWNLVVKCSHSDVLIQECLLLCLSDEDN